MRHTLVLVVACLFGCSKAPEPTADPSAGHPELVTAQTPEVIADSIDGVRRVQLKGELGEIVLKPDHARKLGEILVAQTEECRRLLAGKEGGEAQQRFDGPEGSSVEFHWDLEGGLSAIVFSTTATDFVFLSGEQAVAIGRQLIEAGK